MRQADLAHQTGLETTLMDFLIVGRGVITAPRSGISNVGRNLASEQRENLDFGIASQSENIQFRCRTKVDLSTYYSLRSPLYNLSPYPSPLGAGRTNTACVDSSGATIGEPRLRLRPQKTHSSTSSTVNRLRFLPCRRI